MSDISKKDRKPKRKINWSEYNESLVRRGEMLFDSDFLQNWRAELKIMNEGRVLFIRKIMNLYSIMASNYD